MALCVDVMQHNIKYIIPELQFNVSQILKEITGATRSYTFSVDAFDTLDEDVVFVSPLIGDIQFLRTGSDILVTGTLEATIEKSWGRCLQNFNKVVVVELEELFYPTVDVFTAASLVPPPDADEANEISEQHILDLFEVVRQAFLLENESIRYCKPDCKGLCPQCGQDRNTTSCNCEEDAIDVRWAGLSNLKIDD